MRSPKLLTFVVSACLAMLALSVVLQMLILARLNRGQAVPVSISDINTSDEMSVSIRGISTLDHLPVDVRDVVKVDLYDQTLSTPLPVRVEQ